MINPAAALYAGSFVAGQIGGIALGTKIVQSLMPSEPRQHMNEFDLLSMDKELDRLGMKNPFKE